MANPTTIGPAAKAIIEIRKRNPCMSSTDIAKILHISRERVRQILSKEGLSTRSIRYKLVRTCPQCGDSKHPDRKLCSECREKNRLDKYIQVSCTNCGTLYSKSISRLITETNRGYQHFFCGTKCFGAWAGNTYGFAKTRPHVPLTKVSCYVCSRKLKLLPSRFKRSKTGRFYCCPEHKYIGQEKEEIGD